jgi:hypothetical protein
MLSFESSEFFIAENKDEVINKHFPKKSHEKNSL